MNEEEFEELFGNVPFENIKRIQEYINKNFIPVQKIKDKIRKNEEIINISNDGDLIHELYQENKVLQELLEERIK